MSSSRKCAGRLFQTRAPATAKLLSPNVLCVRGTAHDLSVDERSRRLGPSERLRPSMSSVKYGGTCIHISIHYSFFLFLFLCYDLYMYVCLFSPRAAPFLNKLSLSLSLLWTTFCAMRFQEVLALLMNNNFHRIWLRSNQVQLSNFRQFIISKTSLGLWHSDIL